jgi:outer membrane protein TolC
LGYLTSLSLNLTAQQNNNTKYIFTLDEVIQLAKDQSLDGIAAKHSFRASYYSFRAYKADYLPKLTLNTSPTTYNHSIRQVESVVNEEYQTREVETNTFSTTAGLSLSQNIGWTGGNISLNSDFSRFHNMNDDSDEARQYTTAPIKLQLRQPLNGYNSLKWQKKIEPLKFQEAKQNYIVSMEQVASNAVSYFFALAQAQIELRMAETNYKNAGELYEIAKGRYQIGTIAEDALLQMELRYMQAESNLNNAKMNIEVRQSRLRSFLGFKDNIDIELEINPEVPSMKIPYNKALEYALDQSPDIISYNRRILEAEQSMASAKANKGITMNLNASFGLNKTGYEFKDAYKPKFDDQEGVALSITVPILDWNQAKDRYRNAKSNMEMVETQMQQAETDFRQEIYLQVMQFNMQEDQLRIAAKADTIAQKGYEVSRQRYLNGKVSVTDLNIADSEKDAATKSYIGALQTYWSYFYTVRRITLYDFIKNEPLEEDFSLIVGE